MTTQQTMLTEIPDTIVCDCNGLAFDKAAMIQAQEPQGSELQGWHHFSGFKVSLEAGNVLYKANQPFRAARIRIVPGVIGWRYGFNFTTNIHSVLGKKSATSEGWRFPGLARYGMVLYQPLYDGNLRAWTLKEVTLQDPQEIEIDPNQNIYINVNDGRDAYEDNNGSFELYVQRV